MTERRNLTSIVSLHSGRTIRARSRAVSLARSQPQWSFPESGSQRSPPCEGAWPAVRCQVKRPLIPTFSPQAGRRSETHAGLGGSSTTRAISESVVSLGFNVASVTAGSALALPSAASMTFLSTLAIRRVTTCAAPRSVSVKTVKIDLSASWQGIGRRLVMTRCSGTMTKPCHCIGRRSDALHR